MESGKLRTRVTVQAKTVPETQDSFGSAEEVWADTFDVMAAYQPAGSREFPASWKRFSETTARFVVRSTDETRLIDADKHRIVMSFDHTVSPPISQTWNISPPYPVDGKPFELIIEVSEIK